MPGIAPDPGAAVSNVPPTPDPNAAISTAPPPGAAAPQESFMQHVGDFENTMGNIGNTVRHGAAHILGRVVRNAQEPVEAMGNLLTSPQRATMGFFVGGPEGAMNAVRDPKSATDLTHQLEAKLGIKGITNPAQQAAVDFALQTITDPLMWVGGPAIGGALKVLQKAGMAAEMIPKLKAAAEAAHDLVKPTKAGKFAHGIGNAVTEVTRPFVNAYKDVLFMNPIPHGVGNIGSLNYLANGPFTAMKGLYYGVRGTPKQTLSEMEKYGAAHAFPLGEATGPLKWLTNVPVIGKPLEWWRKHVSVDFLNRLEHGQRGAAWEKLAKEAGINPNDESKIQGLIDQLKDAQKAKAARPKPKMTPDEFKAFSKGNSAGATAEEKAAAQKIEKKYAKVGTRSNPRIAELEKQLGAEKARKQTIADTVNRDLGDYGSSSAIADTATALGGPFAKWRLVTIPSTYLRAVAKHPGRVVTPFRATNAINENVLANQPYHIEPPGPFSDASQAFFNPLGYGLSSSTVGPVFSMDPHALTHPSGLDVGSTLHDLAFGYIPGASEIAPLLGISRYPSMKAPEKVQAAEELSGLFRVRNNQSPETAWIMNYMEGNPNVSWNQAQNAYKAMIRNLMR